MADQPLSRQLKDLDKAMWAAVLGGFVGFILLVVTSVVIGLKVGAAEGAQFGAYYSLVWLLGAFILLLIFSAARNIAGSNPEGAPIAWVMALVAGLGFVALVITSMVVFFLGTGWQALFIGVGSLVGWLPGMAVFVRLHKYALGKVSLPVNAERQHRSPDEDKSAGEASAGDSSTR